MDSSTRRRCGALLLALFFSCGSATPEVAPDGVTGSLPGVVTTGAPSDAGPEDAGVLDTSLPDAGPVLGGIFGGPGFELGPMP